MSHIITLDMPLDVAQRAQVVAERTHRRVEDVLVEWLGRASNEMSLEWLPDPDILALSEQQLSDTAQNELSDLLASQREGALLPTERTRLDALLQEYRLGMMQKAQALKIAVERGLRLPLAS